MALHHSRALTARDIVPAFLLTGGLGLLGSLVFLPLPHHAGAELSGRRGRHSLVEDEPAAIAD
jgi:hypothetical protein